MAININPGSPLRHVSTFNATGNWLAPAGTNIAFVSMHGAAGGGGGASFRYSGNTGGTGGTGVVAGAFVQVTPGASHSITIGAGGTVGLTNSPNQGSRQGNTGATGGTTNFDQAFSALGGAGGNISVNDSNGNAGAGGTATGTTSLTTLSPGANTIPRVGTITSQNTSGQTGGTGTGGGSRYSPPTIGNSGQSGFAHIYI